jgi:pyruvate/2-oxoglutarate/acetoin dehydrogenase E1 component
MPLTMYLHAVVDGIQEELRRDPRTFLMGEDIQSKLYYGKGATFLEEFGPERIRNTPMSEAAFVGAGIGAAMTGTRPIIDLGVASFLYVAMDQLISQAAKSRYMFGSQATIPLTIRTVMYYGGGMAAQHSDRPYPLFMHIPGFKVVAPSNAFDAKGLLKSAIRDDDVVIVFEDITLHSAHAEVPDEEYLVPLGRAAIVREGSDVTIVAIAGSVAHALQAADHLAQEGISAEVVDPRTLVPLDTEAILRSVTRTGRLVIADPAHRVCGAASEIAAVVAEQAFDSLSARIVRITAPQVHIPFSSALERDLYPSAAKIGEAARELCGVRA